MIKVAAETFHEQLSMKKLSIVAWESEYSEVRLEEETAAHRGIVRFRVKAKNLHVPD